MGGMGGGAGGTVEPDPTYDLLGAWEQVCDVLDPGEAMDDCLAEPWELMLGKAVLGGPATLVSQDGPCGGGESVGTFSYADQHLELFNCGAGDPQNAVDAKGLLFDVTFADEGERMVLVHEETEYVLQRAERPPTSVSAARLLWVDEWRCTDEEPRIFYHIVDHGATDAWASTLTLQGGELFMDEFFDQREGTGMDDWGFYDSDHRGAQTATFPLASGITASHYRVTHAPDLTPVYAVGFEADDCEGDASTLRGFEYDFVRDVEFRRFWSSSSEALGATVDIEVAGLAGTVNELIVTVDTDDVVDAAKLTLSLTSPDGTTVELASGVAGDGTIGNFEYTSFADYAQVSVANDELTSFEDLLAPQNALSAFEGEAKNGTWTLTVSTSGDSGTVTYFGLSIR